jgi:hypothetical protein
MNLILAPTCYDHPFLDSKVGIVRAQEVQSPTHDFISQSGFDL